MGVIKRKSHESPPGAVTALLAFPDLKLYNSAVASLLYDSVSNHGFPVPRLKHPGDIFYASDWH
jgi:hypothetical protein